MLEINGVLICPIGNDEAFCPSCGSGLQKFPQKKTKCPHCAEFIYSRTQPFDGVKRLINSAGATALESQWLEFSKFKDLVARLRFSPLMQEYLEDLCNGDRGMTRLHPRMIGECAKGLSRRSIGRDWQDPPAQWFDPQETVAVTID